jgi:hypothetical protein
MKYFPAPGINFFATLVSHGVVQSLTLISLRVPRQVLSGDKGIEISRAENIDEMDRFQKYSRVEF